MEVRELRLEAAIAAATRLHAGQLDKAGLPYILHPLRVMLAMETPEERILAVLHDTVEDRGWRALLGELGVDSEELLPEWLVKGLDALTRREGETYEAFVERAGRLPMARRVKIADLRDNLDLSRLPRPPTERDRRRSEKYARALRLLGA